MASEFDPALSTAKDRIRLKLGDITEPFLFPDETYNAMLAYYGGIENRATVELARSLISQFSQKASSVQLISGTTFTWRDRLLGWQEVIKQLDTGPTSGVSSGIQILKPSRSGDEDRGEYYRGDTWFTS